MTKETEAVYRLLGRIEAHLDHISMEVNARWFDPRDVRQVEDLISRILKLRDDVKKTLAENK